MRGGLRFDILLAARVDAIEFQIIFHLGKFQALNTFDEGLYSILKESSYNSHIQFGKNEKKKKIINFFFGVPFPTSQYLLLTERHFTWFNAESFAQSVIERNKITEIHAQEKVSPISKIFIGQPWHYMDFNKENIQSLSQKINDLDMDLYISHPREDLLRIEDLLNPSIQIISLNQDIELFLNKIASNNNIRVFTFGSSAVVHLESSIKISVVKLRDLNERTQSIQTNLINALKKLDKDYESI